ncbi:hypothetical protein, partial [Flavonifractor plautii]|uniref:hypothetical protein n=1 Tax=Flavonifractor plautii TaxID=292800 RepID=UPI001A9B0857
FARHNFTPFRAQYTTARRGGQQKAPLTGEGRKNSDSNDIGRDKSHGQGDAHSCYCGEGDPMRPILHQRAGQN